MQNSENTNSTPEKPFPANASAGQLRMVSGGDANLVFAQTIAYLMKDDVFGRMPFGQIAKLVAGQVNRKHYAFAVRGNTICGYVGWTCCTVENAERWLKDQSPTADHVEGVGPVCVLNIWKADGDEEVAATIRSLKSLMPDKTHVYAKRYYPDGTIKPVRLTLRNGYASGARPGGKTGVSENAQT